MEIQVENELNDPLRGQRIVFVGKLGGFTKREAQQLVRQYGGVPVESQSSNVDVIVIGADELPLGDDELLDGPARHAAAEGRLEIISETQLWQQLGLVEREPARGVRRLYTPAMLADLLSVSVSVIRRWHRRGLIVPVREAHRLPYFDFQEVSTARRLAHLLASGASPAAIEKKLERLARFVPDVDRPLAQLSVIVEGKEILLRQGEGLVDPGGQLRINFDTHADTLETGNLDSQHTIVAFDQDIPTNAATPEAMINLAEGLEECGELRAATDMYRAALAAGGRATLSPRRDSCSPRTIFYGYRNGRRLCRGPG